MKQKFRNRGLPSLKHSAVDRRRQLVTGRARVGGGIPPKLFLWGLAFLLGSGFIYFQRAQAELEQQRSAIFNKQRATAQLLSPKLIPLRDAMEKYVAELAKPGKELITSGTDFQKVLSSPTVYLRVRLDEALDRVTLRRAAAESLRDGFTSCLMRDPSAVSPTSGRACRESTECAPGELCNEYKKCGRPSSPFNMRLLYRGLLILSEEWTKEVKEAGTDTKLLAYDRSLDAVTRVDIPVAIEVHQRAQYALIVIDEDPKEGLPKPVTEEYESPAERVQRVAHAARVGIWDIRQDQLLARLNGEADGELRAAGTRSPELSAETEAARARLAKSCGLALQIKSKLLTAAAGSAETPTASGTP